MESDLTSPCFQQDDESVVAWLRANVRPGCEVVVRRSQGGLLSYTAGKVVRLGRGRFEVGERARDGVYGASGEAFYYSGKNCWHPKGQTRLVIPTPEVLHACDVCDANGGFLPALPWSYRVSFG